MGEEEDEYIDQLAATFSCPYANEPATSPWRNMGRNDPCPCGSGKKAKRCCLAA
ncbi:SEC-C metal-binding domain-containing protein [Reyranella sp.]|uniref:SEC-C metal-binding domain-containing protein n=1 Tax=Reyranella sp. TaxID=1929291 RepID=UPI003D0F5C3A